MLLEQRENFEEEIREEFISDRLPAVQELSSTGGHSTSGVQLLIKVIILLKYLTSGLISKPAGSSHQRVHGNSIVIRQLYTNNIIM